MQLGGLVRKRPTYRTVARSQRFPVGTEHQLTTGGVRVEQVGVKSLWRAVAAVAVVEFGTTQPLGWKNSTGGVSQGASPPVVSCSLLLATWGLVDSKVCSRIVFVAEADQRHVAHLAPVNSRVSRGSSAQ